MKKLTNIVKWPAMFLAFSCMVLHGATFVNLGTAGNYVILTESGITTTGPTSIVGDLGVSPIAGTAYTGFDETLDLSGQYATSILVTGRLFAANYAVPTPSLLGQAIGGMHLAYTDAAGRINPDFLNLGTGILNGDTLAPGLYKWTSALSIVDSISFDGGGDETAIWILQVDNRLSLSTGAQILLSGGAKAENIFWQTAEGATFGTGSHFEGILLTATDIAVQTNASANGQLYAQTAATLDSNNIVRVLPIPEPSGSLLLMGGLAAVTLVRRK